MWPSKPPTHHINRAAEFVLFKGSPWTWMAHPTLQWRYSSGNAYRLYNLGFLYDYCCWSVLCWFASSPQPQVAVILHNIMHNIMQKYKKNKFFFFSTLRDGLFVGGLTLCSPTTSFVQIWGTGYIWTWLRRHDFAKKIRIHIHTYVCTL